MNDQLEQIRLQINETDEQLSRLLSRRMDLVAQVAKIKETAGLPIYDPQREKRVLEQVSQSVGAEKSPYLRRVYQSLMDASKDYERALMETVSIPSQRLETAFPSRPKVACQGVPGAFSGEAARRMFPEGDLIFVHSWEDAFEKVSQGECDFAVLPAENSLAGSVGQVYDLLLQYRLMISKACRLPVEQNLLALPGATLDDINEIYSHPQGLAQCKKSAVSYRLPGQSLWRIRQRRPKWLLRWEISIKRPSHPLTVQRFTGCRSFHPTFRRHSTIPPGLLPFPDKASIRNMPIKSAWFFRCRTSREL